MIWFIVLVAVVWARDDKVTIYLQYDNRDRLARMQMEMKPYHSLPIFGTTLHWAR